MPDYTREGGSIPVTLDFANILNLNVLLLPVGRGDDGAHSTNEKIDTDNYIRVRISLLYQNVEDERFLLNMRVCFYRAPNFLELICTSLLRLRPDSGCKGEWWLYI